MTRWLYYVENGAQEVIRRGRLLSAPPAATLLDEGEPREDWGSITVRTDSDGWYVMGAYNTSNGRGFGRVVPAEAVPYMKLLGGPNIGSGWGFELFPSWRRPFEPYTSYLFAVTGGAEEVLSVGGAIADRARPAAPTGEHQ